MPEVETRLRDNSSVERFAELADKLGNIAHAHCVNGHMRHDVGLHLGVAALEFAAECVKAVRQSAYDLECEIRAVTQRGT